ncbi:MAG: hypothetical protein VYC39_03025 [Myxococcota bacterium]|nr:hypothetical protein [Myxococcota bacterium]
MKGLAIILSTAVACSVATDSLATVVKAHTLNEKTELSSLIVRGTVKSVTTDWYEVNASAHTLITLKISEVLKGTMPKTKEVTIRQPGGKIGDFDHRVEGVSQWEANEEVIMFLEPLRVKGHLGLFIELGIGIGKYEIRYKNKKAYVHHNPKVALAHYDASQKMTVEPAKKMTPVSIEQFRTEVRSYVNGKKRIRTEPKPVRSVDVPLKNRKSEARQ